MAWLTICILNIADPKKLLFIKLYYKSKIQNRDYNRSHTKVYNVAPLSLRMLFYTHSIYMLERWRRRLSLVCNNQNLVTSLKMLDGYRTSELLPQFDEWK